MGLFPSRVVPKTLCDRRGHSGLSKRFDSVILEGIIPTGSCQHASSLLHIYMYVQVALLLTILATLREAKLIEYDRSGRTRLSLQRHSYKVESLIAIPADASAENLRLNVPTLRGRTSEEHHPAIETDSTSSRSQGQ